MNRIFYLFLMLGFCLVTGCSKQSDIMIAEENTSVTNDSMNVSQMVTETTTQEMSFIYVYVCGHVEKAGVYPLKIGSRICDALELAGGVTEDGKPEALNQAEYVEDGQTIYVPGIDEEMAIIEAEDGLVDINQADKETLMTLPGIGESKADIIIQYREEHGSFESVEELMDIPGIKEGVFNKIKNLIKVS